MAQHPDADLFGYRHVPRGLSHLDGLDGKTPWPCPTLLVLRSALYAFWECACHGGPARLHAQPTLHHRIVIWRESLSPPG
jgi:hypothetical protein